MTLVKFKRPNVLFPSIVDDFWKDFAPAETASYVPSVNIREEEQSFHLELVAPGFDKKDINIAVEDEVLTISGTHTENKEETRDNYVTREFRTGSFKRSFNLAKQIDTDRIQRSTRQACCMWNSRRWRRLFASPRRFKWPETCSLPR